MQLFCYLCLSIFPLINFLLFYRLFRTTIGRLLSYLSFKFLECSPNIIAFRLFLVQFILKLKRHFVVSILSLLQLDSSLMYLSKNIKVFMFVHRCFVSLINKDVIFVSHFFDFCLHHSVMIIKSLVSIFSLTDSQLQLLFDLFLNRKYFTFEVIFSFIACSLASSSSSSGSSYSYSSATMFDYSSSSFY